MSAPATTTATAARRPVFAISHDAIDAETLEASWGAAEPELPLQMVPVDWTESRPRRTLQGLAADLVRRIRMIQPAGPYRLAAWGDGGLLAYEVAVRMLGADQQIELLAIVDASPSTPVDRGARPGAALQQALRAYEVPASSILIHRVSRGIDAPSPAWLSRVPARQVRTVAEGALLGTPPRGTALARALASAAKELRSPPELGYTPMVPIQAGARGTPPIVCIPGAGASITDFVPFSGAVGAQWPVVGFQPRGMDGVMVPYATVESAAGAYLNELVKVAPRGEVRLVGHSFGSWIAFEMALRLRAAGRPVACLTILDGDYPGGEGRVGHEYTRPEALIELVSLYEQAAERSLNLKLEDFQSRDAGGQLSLLHARLVQVGLVPARSSPELLRGTVRTFEDALRTEYEPSGTFDGPVKMVLVRGFDETQEQAERRFGRVVSGWARLAPKIQFRRGPGNHVTLLKAPNVSQFAGWSQDVSSLGDPWPAPVMPRNAIGADVGHIPDLAASIDLTSRAPADPQRS
ncbi:MAG TPA: thioesterase domain-containing protein [Polyangia bacterium]|nr:thioesterase domain-containing protein [Polyangia bacterium]